MDSISVATAELSERSVFFLLSKARKIISLSSSSTFMPGKTSAIMVLSSIRYSSFWYANSSLAFCIGRYTNSMVLKSRVAPMITNSPASSV